MKFHQVDRLADHVVLPALAAVVALGRVNTAETLAYIAVADARKLYLPAAYPSMYQYCLGELHMSEGAAARRIHAARAARQFPAIFDAVEQGRLHLSAVVLLAPHLTAGNAAELLAAATHKTKAGIERMLAERFPRADLATLIQPIAATSASRRQVHESVCERESQQAPGPVAGLTSEHTSGHAAIPASSPAPGQAETFAPRPKITPLAPQRFALQVTVDQATHDKLRRAQELLAHVLPSGDVAQVLDRALDALVHELERRRLATTGRPRSQRSAANGRYIPAEVKRKVVQRDGDQCTFVSESGHRCGERKFLEYDHVDAVARGGKQTAGNLQLRCRAHNQYAAERAFGRGFMDQKRQEARRRSALACEAAPARVTKLARNGTANPAAPA